MKIHHLETVCKKRNMSQIDLDIGNKSFLGGVRDVFFYKLGPKACPPANQGVFRCKNSHY